MYITIQYPAENDYMKVRDIDVAINFP